MELGEALGVEGFGADLFNTVGSTVTQHVIGNLLTDAQLPFKALNVGGIADGMGGATANLASALVSAVGAFIGAKLGAMVVSPQTQAGMVLSSVGSAVGTYVFGVGASSSGAIGAFATGLSTKLGSLGNFVVPGIGAFVGFVLGTLIGNLFGRKKPKVPTANAEVYLDYTSDKFQLGASSAANGGNLDLVRNMAESARDTLNGFLTVLAGDMPYQATSWGYGLWRNGGYISTPAGVQSFYGHTGGQLWVKLGNLNGAQQNVASADDAVSKGVMWSIKQTQVIGGDIFAKRALANSAATDLTALLGDLQIASDYRFYANNRELINGYITGAYNSLTAAEKTYYASNKALIDKAHTQGVSALTTAQKNTYNANKAKIDKIIMALEDQAIANPWIITLQRINELKLDKWSKSDFYGGLQGFLTSMGLPRNGANFEDLSVYTVNGGMQLMFGAASQDGAFSLLPQARTGGRSITVASGELATIGYTKRTSGSSAGNDFIDASASTTAVNLSDSITHTTPGYWEWRGPGREPLVPTYPDADGSPGPGYFWVEGTTYTVTGGDDIFIGGSAGDTLSGMEGWDWLDGGGGADKLYGGAGNDVLLGGAGNDQLFGGADDDYLAGGAGNDTLNGEDGADTLIGGAGLDTINGGAGDDFFIVDYNDGQSDYLIGGAGSDTLSFERWEAGVTLTMGVASTTAGYFDALGDRYKEIENLTGTRFNDTLTGDAGHNILKGGDGDDVLSGGSGNDTLEGGAGADRLTGGAGTDTVSYESSNAGVFIDFTTLEAFGGHATGDTFSSVENIRGSRFADELKGNTGANRIDGGAGDDWIVATKGADTYVGGEGIDTVDYSDGFATSGSVPGLNIQGSIAYWRATDGVTGTHSLSGVEHVIGTAGADTITLTGADEFITAGKGNDILNGGAGSDTYYFNLGDGVDTITETNVGSNVVSFGQGIGFNQLTFTVVAGPTGHMTIHYSATDSVRVNGNLPNVKDGKLASADDNKLKVIDMNGSGQLDVSQFEIYRGGTAGADTLNGIRTLGDFLVGFGGNDTIHGMQVGQWSEWGDIIIGGAGNDTSFTSTGDDQFAFERGSGRDTINDTGGDDTLVFGPNVAADDVIYKVVGNDLYIGIADAANPNLEAHQVADYVRVVGGGVKFQDVYSGGAWFNTVEFVNAGGIWIDLRKLDINWTVQNTYTGGVLPIVFDLEGDGLELTGVDHSMVVSRLSSGELARTSWVGPTDGILAVDRNGDGQINQLSEISFVQDKEGAQTDLEGLQGWDTNGDGKLNALDEGWGQLKIWVDRNQNGRSTESELRTLEEAGITEINLTGKATGKTADNTRDSFVHNTLSFTWASGETGTAYDVQLARKLLNEYNLSIDQVKAIWGEDRSVEGELGRLVNDPVVAAAARTVLDAGRSLRTQDMWMRDSLLLRENVDADMGDAAVDGADGAIVTPPTADFSDHDDLYAEDEARWADVLFGEGNDEKVVNVTDPSVRASLEAFFGQTGRGSYGAAFGRPGIDGGVDDDITHAATNMDGGNLDQTSPRAMGGFDQTFSLDQPPSRAARQTGGADFDPALAAAADLISVDPTDVWAPVEFGLASTEANRSWWIQGESVARFNNDALPPAAWMPITEGPSTSTGAEQHSQHQKLTQALASFGREKGASAAVWKRSGEAEIEATSQMLGASGSRFAALARMPA